MATEPNFSAVLPVLLTANGTSTGILHVTDTIGFFFGMQATLANNTPSQITVYIKRVVDSTTLWVGPTKAGMDLNVDLSAYTVATASNIGAKEQKKQTVPMEARLLATYATDPINAWRTQTVDPYGNPYTSENPLPVAIDGDVTIGVVEVKGTNGNFIEPNADGSIKTVQLFTIPYDTITATYPTSTQEVYKSRVGGVGGTVQQTVTVDYTDATKNYITSAVRTPI